ncbi:unnamed protein product, partial [Sphacelaria rigidula]
VPQDKLDSWRIDYDFSYAGKSTVGLPRDGDVVPYVPSAVEASRDTPPGRYSKKVC